MHNIALKMNILLWPVVVLTLGFAAMFLLSLFDLNYKNYTIPGLLGVIWGISGIGFILGFRQDPGVIPETGFIQRFKWRAKKMVLSILALSFVGLGLAVIYTSLRLLKLWF